MAIIIQLLLAALVFVLGFVSALGLLFGMVYYLESNENSHDNIDAEFLEISDKYYSKMPLFWIGYDWIKKYR